MSTLQAVVKAADRQAEAARAVMRVAQAAMDALREEAAGGFDVLIAAAVAAAEASADGRDDASDAAMETDIEMADNLDELGIDAILDAGHLDDAAHELGEAAAGGDPDDVADHLLRMEFAALRLAVASALDAAHLASAAAKELLDT
ncbi:MAG: hypothetical protein F4Z02_12565 [Acidimicrobiia bacterium]|nr:hypothetical protein [Acidimicrobiia bacterium]MYG72752.1 hypothetical protein [Acidimicrobiia bacterium]